MGLIFNGNGDVIKAVDGSLTVEGLDIDDSSTNINAGIVTGTSANFTGNVSVGGVLTYEDVKNVDSVGVVTARDGIDCNGDIDVDGHTNLDNVSVAGVTTFQGTIVSLGVIDLADSIAHASDSNTKIRFPANDTVSVETAGTERLRITSSGNVGINTTTTPHKLTVKGTISAVSNSGSGIQIINLSQDGSNNGSIVVNDSSGVTRAQFLASGVSYVRGGNFGVGIANPSSIFHVRPLDETNFLVRNEGSTVVLASETNSGRDNNRAMALEASHFEFIEGGSEKVRIDSSGRLLIGTTTEGNSVADDLTIAGSGDSGITIRSGTSSEGSLMFSDATSGSAEHAGWICYNHNSNFLRFFTNATERLRITSDGDLCVGKTSAIGKAEIHTGASEIGLTVSNSTHDSQFQILASAANKNSSIFFGDAGDGNIGWIDYDHNDNSLSFRVNGSTRAWFDNSNTLYLQGTSHTNLEVRSNSASTKAIIQTVQDSDVRMGATTNHPLALYAGTSERLRIDTNGDVIIGATSTTGGDRLEVVDSSNNQFRLTRPSTQSYQFGIVSGGHLYIAGSSNGEMVRFQSDLTTKFTKGTSGGTVAHFYANARESNILIQNDARTWKIVNYDYGNNGTDHLGFHDGNADRFVIGSNGYLGAGVTQPTEALQILKSHNGHTRIVVQNNWGSNATAQLKLISPTDEFQLIKYASGDAALNLSNSADIYFSIGGSERLRIKSGGDIEVGNKIVHSGDTDTYLHFQNNTFIVHAGNNARINANSNMLELGGTRQFNSCRQYQTNSTSSWTTILTFSTNTSGFSMECIGQENSYSTLHRVTGSAYWNSCYYTADFGGDSNHAHSSDLMFRVTNTGGTRTLEFKAIQYTTTRLLTIISIWVKNGYVTWS